MFRPLGVVGNSRSKTWADAGAGYAGLQHILRLRTEILKLDMGLTRGIDADPARRALATALVHFAADIDSMIVAEGVETSEELDTLRSLGVQLAPGISAGTARPPLPLNTAVRRRRVPTLPRSPPNHGLARAGGSNRIAAVTLQPH